MGENERELFLSGYVKYKKLDSHTAHGFERAGLKTPSMVIEAIQKFGLHSSGGGNFIFGLGGPRLYMIGRHRWRIMLSFLEGLGFDWRKHIERPTEKYEYQLESQIEEKIDDLIILLRVYKGIINK